MTSLTEVLLGLAAALGCWWLYFFAYPRLRLDETRQNLFRIRDDFFRLAEQGAIAFDCDAYRLVRLTLNGMIRYAHQLSLIQLLVAGHARKRYGPDLEAAHFAEAVESAIESLAQEQQLLVRRTLNAMHREMLLHMMRKAPIFATICALWIVARRRAVEWRRQGGIWQLAINAGDERALYPFDAKAQRLGVRAAHGC